MSQNDEILQKLYQLLSHKKSNLYYATKLGISEQEVEELRKQLKATSTSYPHSVEVPIPTATEWIITTTTDVEKGTYNSTMEIDFEPKTVEDLAKLHKIDLTKYKISNYWSKLKANGKFTSSVFATSKKKADYTPEDFANFLQTFELKPSFGYTNSGVYTSKPKVDIELNISDFHLAKKTFQGDSLESKEFDYYRVVNNLISKVKANYNIRKIVFPISNDFFHSDNIHNQTTNGTPQDVTAWYDEEYEKGFDILANTINYLVSQAESVEVILVQGNHDRTKGFYVAHALEVFFKEYKNVSFQKHHSTTKCVVLGNTFIGYHHGNCKIEDLPLLFATGKDSLQFGAAKYREVHTGDKHHYMAKEVKGVRIQQMPSLSGDDRWHVDHNYVHNLKAGLALVYDPEKGKIAEFEERL